MDFSQFELKHGESEERMRYVRSLPPGSHIHLSAICGTGMGSVASLLKQLGYRISGSDKAFYPPMGDVVRSLTSEIYEGYNPENLATCPALVVIGNNLSSDNPEVKETLARGIPYASMPEVIGALLIRTREEVPTSVVVTGTHGKTTTTAAIATMLEQAGRSPGYMIGGVPLDLPGQVRPGTREVVTEGDEYDSAFFAKWPKFLSYRPDILIITSIEFDHADIYENIEEIEREFDRLVSLVPETGAVLVSTESSSLQKLSARWRDSIKARLITYGKGGELSVVERRPIESGQELRLKLLDSECLFVTPLSGPQNAANLLAAAGVGQSIGLSPEVIASGLSRFRGVLRRQTDHGTFGGAKLIEDFAHHPTAVELTLMGIRESSPGKRLIAAFEPRSNTTRRGFFQDEYPRSLSLADVVLMPEQKNDKVYSATSITAEPLNVSLMVERIKALGREAYCFSDISSLAEWIVQNRGAEDVVVCMSNGDFGGLINLLKRQLPALHAPDVDRLNYR